MIVGHDEHDITKSPTGNPATGTHALVFGPYRIEPGQKAKLVIAFVGGSAPDWLGEDEITWSLKPEAKLELTNG
jgi:hypothetical protein